MEDLTGGLEAEAFAGPMVDLADLRAQLLVRDLAQVGAFGQVLA
jgi:hypothetical protein